MHAARKKVEARTLRENGLTLSEISSALQISKSTASLWLRDTLLSKEASIRIEARRNEGRAQAAVTHRRNKSGRLEKADVVAARVLANASMNIDTSRLLCALLYRCEGARMRSKSTFSFTNSDPQLIATFMRLLRLGFAIDERKLRLNIHLHEYHDQDAQLRFWSKMASIPLQRCHKPYRKPHTAVRTREGYQGCASVRYYDTNLGYELEAIATHFLKNK